MLGPLWAFILFIIFFLCYYYDPLREIISPARVKGTEPAERTLSPVCVQRLWKVQEMLPHKSFSPLGIQLYLGKAVFALPLSACY